MKTQIKKSISLFLAVLMVLSCWVWVAPEKAEAANIELKDKYYVEIDLQYYNNSTANWNADKGGIYYKTLGDGWGTESQYQTVKANMNDYDSGEGTDVVKFSTTDFPTVIRIAANGGGGASYVGIQPARIQVNGIRINGKPVATGSWGFNGEAFADKEMVIYPYDAEGNSGNGDLSYNWPRPRIVGFIDESEPKADPISVKLGKLNSGEITESTEYDFSQYTCYNQYGVAIPKNSLSEYVDNKNKEERWCTISETSTYVASANNGGEPLSGLEADDVCAVGGASNDVVIKPTLQVNKPNGTNGDGTATYYLVRKYVFTDQWGGTSTSKVSAKIDIKYPDYTTKFDAVGSIKGDFDPVITDVNGSTYTDVYNAVGYYNKTFTLPTENVVGRGYTFYGFWSDEQPTEGYGSFTADTTEFAIPCTSDDFEQYAKSGEVDENDPKIVVYENRRYYNAGQKWTKDIKTITGDVTYHGWWLASQYTVSFYDIDGKYFNTQTIKFGQDQNSIEWPVSAYIDSSYVSGAMTIKPVKGEWVHANGELVKENGHVFDEGYNLILTPKTNNEFKSSYDIVFVDQNGGTINKIDGVTYTGSHAYREMLAFPGERAVPRDIASDLQYSYEFLGWSTATPCVDGKNYHVLIEDANFDVEGNAVGINEDWIVRSNATYYPVYRRHLRSYTVTFWYNNSSAESVSSSIIVKYGEAITAPTELVPYTYAQGGYGRTFKGWSYKDTLSTSAVLDYAGSLDLTSENFYIQSATAPITIQATYSSPVATPYTITFLYKDEKGEDATYITEVSHNKYITQSIINRLKPANEYDNGKAIVTFSGTWKVVSGTAVNGKTIYETKDLTSFSPVSFVTFEAVYGDPKPFYMVTYVDGDNTYSERVLVNDFLPAWVDETTSEVYTPTMPENEKGSFEFVGWYDEKQTDKTYADVNGNKYEYEGENRSVVGGNITLYPQFIFVPTTYEITFMAYDGKTVLKTDNFKYGEDISELVNEANEEANNRADDETYTYTFIGWDKTVPTTCEGKDMTFVAIYKPIYRDYLVKWYGSIYENGQWNIDKSNLITTTKHTFNSKLYSPLVEINIPESSDPTKRYVFDGWYYMEDGVAKPYVRGTAVKGEMEFFAKYTLTDKPVTVTTIVGETTKTITVAYGESADIIEIPVSGYVNATNHNEFEGWYIDDGFTTAFEAETITSNITLYANFTVSAHDFTNEETKKDPTYYAAGEKLVWCSCNKEETDKTVAIPMLTDNVDPTGTIYLGTLGSWSSTDEVGAVATDGDPVKYFANPETRIIITANDTGDVNTLYNESGIGKGIRLIRAFAFPADEVLTAESYGVAAQIAHNVYTDTSTDLTNTANYTVKLKDLKLADLDEVGRVQYNADGTIKTKDLEDGKKYIVYYTIFDKAGNQLNTKVRTAKFVYDATAPEITVVGNSNASKNPNIVTYCEKATLSNVEVGATLKINGDPATLTTTSAAGLGSYTIEGAGNYLITVTDKAGNSASKKIIIVEEHATIEIPTPATCTEDGSKVIKCTLCDSTISTVAIPATGHKVSVESTAANCTDNATKTYACETCDLSVTIEYDAIWSETLDETNVVKFNDEAVVNNNNEGNIEYLVYTLGENDAKQLIDAAKDHVYTDAEGEYIYTVTTPATCYSAGVEKVLCTVCKAVNTEVAAREIPANTDGHDYGKVKYVSATCTQDGYTYTNCKICGSFKKITDILKAEHNAQWIVVTKATCGKEGTMKEVCSKCQMVITETTAYDWVEVANGDYTYVYKTDKEGNYELDANGDKIIVSDERANFVTGEVKTYYQIYRLPKTNKHIYQITKSEATTTTPGKTEYKCTECGYSKIETVDKLIEYTVYFANGTGEPVEIKAGVGESVTIADPTKAATDKVKYTFIGWADEEDDIVKLPLTMSESLNGKTFTAQYKETPILYTHIFKVPTTYVNGKYDGYVTFKVLMGAMDAEVKVSEDPVFAPDGLSKQYAFEFDVWERVGADETDFIVDGDATFEARFTAIPNKYQVIFYTSATKYIWSTSVDAGNKVTYNKKDENGNLVKPATTFDDNYHYTFNNTWYTDSTLETVFNFDTEEIYANTRLYAGYDKTAHNYVKAKEAKQEATCTQAEIYEYSCDVCGHTIERVTPDSIKDHDWDENGKCNGCGAIKVEDVVTHTVIFVDVNGTTTDKYTVVSGEKINYDVDTPTKVADKEYTYTFSMWVDAFGNKYTVDQVKNLVIDKDYKFSPDFSGTKNTYTVTYVDKDNTAIQIFDKIEYGSVIPSYEIDEEYLKYSDDTHHYVFASWSVDANATVKDNIVIKPIYNATPHDYTVEVETKATCTTKGEVVLKCNGDGCEAKQVLITNTPALGHTDVYKDANDVELKVEHTIVEPDKNNGYICTDTYTCTRCGEKIVKNVTTVELTIKVNGADKKPAAPGSATVTITNKATGKTYKTNNDENGEAKFIVMANQEWTVGVTGETLPDGGYGTTINKGQTSIELGENTTEEDNKDDEEVETGDECSCSCHKNSFWGMLYRFFQNIIAKLFKGGKVNCCDNPDPRYNK